MTQKAPQLTLLSTLLVGSTISLTASASGPADNEFSLGLGVGYGQSIYKDADNQTTALPMLHVRYGDFYFEGLEGGYILTETDVYALSIALAGDDLDGERTESRTLRDMGDVDSGLNLKLNSELMTDFGLISASIAQDISDEHEGTEAMLGLSLPLGNETFEVMPTVYASWMSEDLVNHYYGVSAGQAKAGRAAYKADDGWRYGVEVMALYPLSAQWALSGGVGMEWYSDKISDSPIVEDDSAVHGFIGVSYSF